MLTARPPIVHHAEADLDGVVTQTKLVSTLVRALELALIEDNTPAQLRGPQRIPSIRTRNVPAWQLLTQLAEGVSPQVAALMAQQVRRD